MCESDSPQAGEGETSALHGCDHFLDQASETADVAAGIDGIAETNDDEMLRRQDNDSLALIAKRKKRVARDSHLDAPLRTFVFAAIGPETRAVVGIARCSGRKIHPVFVQDASATDNAVVQIEQSESRPVPGACQHG